MDARRQGRQWPAAMLAVVVLAAAILVTGFTAPPAQALNPFTAKGSVNQVYTFGHAAGTALQLVDASSTVVAAGVADSQGAFIFKDVPKASGYAVAGQGGTTVGGLDVSGPTDHPPSSFYSAIDLGSPPPGQTSMYTYIPTRDGTLLSATVNFPKDGSVGPWPVVIDYSGYDPSSPPGPPAEAQMFPFAGYVTVGINLRGTTCSGGAFDLWETLQTLDGYDAVETLAHQSWSNGHVGMVGISYMGISQLFVAQTNPPHLDAITPLSVYADFYRGIGYPGGIINKGFFLDWLGQRDADSEPAAHAWVQQRITDGDTVCAQNQVLRGQSHKLIPEATPGRYNEARGDYLSPQTFVGSIHIPTFISGAFEDEQTGGHWSTMVNRFGPAAKLKVAITNGTHVESLGPEHFARLLEFVDFYVGHRVPVVPPILRVGAPLLFADLFGTPNTTLPPDRFTGQTYGAALAAYEAEPPVRIYWENGAGRDPGEPLSTAQVDYASWPLPGATGQAYYFQPDGHLTTTAPTVPDAEARGASSYRYDPSSKNPKRTFTGSTSDIWKPLPDLTWNPLVEGKALSFQTDPFTTTTTFGGWASADLWIRSTAVDTDLEVTLTEVRPDGKENFIQQGWLRASNRKIDATNSDALMPRHSYLAADAQPLVPGQWDLARVEIYPFAHVLRPGSRLRINVEAPGGDQPFWEVDPSVPGSPVTNDIAHSIGRPSKIVLPVVPAALNPPVPTTLPPCPGLRNRPCRDFLPARIPTAVVATPAGGGLDLAWQAPPGAAPDSYVITTEPGGATRTVPGTATSLHLDGLTIGTGYRFTVTAVYAGSPAPASDASLTVVVVAAPVTTTSTAAPTTTPPVTEGVAAPSSAAPTAAPTTVLSSGALPATGTDSRPLVTLAAALVLVGAALLMVARRRRGVRAP